MENCRLDQMAKRSWDDSASVALLRSLPTVMASCRLSSLCWTVNYLLYLWTRSLACHPLLSSKCSIALVLAPWAACARKVCKLCKNPYISIVNPLWTDVYTYIHTYKHTYKHSLRLRPHKHPLHPHDYEPHAKLFGNNVLKILILIEHIIQSSPRNSIHLTWDRIKYCSLLK